ncbi:ABC transporter permease [Streptomyces sp. NPDC001617]
MSSRLIWLRWSWRDLRQRWVLVLAIALTIALGTGAYAGFTGTADWRTRSYDASYAKLDMHDVRVTLTKGTTAPAGILGIAAGVTLVLAVLIAFNAASISADERSRENATMFAFGLPVRTVLTMAVAESALLGTLGTVAGILLGQGIDRWMVQIQLARTMPEIGFDVTLAPGTYLTALLLGIGAVALTPLLTTRRLRRMNIPATLRVVE